MCVQVQVATQSYIGNLQNAGSILDAEPSYTTQILIHVNSSLIFSMISQVNRPLKCCTTEVRLFFPTQSGLSFGKRMFLGQI